MQLLKTLLSLSVVLIFAAACEDPEQVTRTAPLLANGAQAGPAGNASTRVSDLRGALNGRQGDTRRLGTDDFLGEDTAGDDAARNLVDITDDGEITLNLLDVPIEDAARAVLGDTLGRNYTITPGVQGSVTLQTTRPLTKKALLETFETILELNGATLQSATT